MEITTYDGRVLRILSGDPNELVEYNRMMKEEARKEGDRLARERLQALLGDKDEPKRQVDC